MVDKYAEVFGESTRSRHRQYLIKRIATAERRAGEIREKLLVLGRRKVDDREIAHALSVFDPSWETLTSGEKARVMQLLIERIDFDGGTGEMRIAFRDSGIEVLTGAANKHDHAEINQ